MKISVLGSNGRMGQMNIAEVEANAQTSLHEAVDKGDSIEQAVKGANAIIDFSSPKATLECSKFCAENGVTHVIGTTGLTDEDKAEIANNAKGNVTILAPNMSIGVNLMFSLVEKVSAILAAEDYDIEVLEMHHNQKVDSPSGTALGLGEAAAKGRGVNLNDVACYERYGETDKRPEGEIGFATLRGGSVVGDHTVMFASGGDRIELTHKASDRTIYSKGAVRACIWAESQPNGVYSMQDVLGV